ncbi:hypothetical protein AURDEDRAFT_175502 [Auricularia subglabra TFB-10046 SS5]|uniref:Uncharacterized protein n=1 Tax=Auricularia subglabra (strain TFB-10046 / SS5) TaxID=717982 RepID=J0D882_AURST|nr:hypothetical protein AURDEDRAFT_175502 [Auricularia subglabra TFB-10046 SS5]
MSATPQPTGHAELRGMVFRDAVVRLASVGVDAGLGALDSVIAQALAADDASQSNYCKHRDALTFWAHLVLTHVFVTGPPSALHGGLPASLDDEATTAIKGFKDAANTLHRCLVHPDAGAEAEPTMDPAFAAAYSNDSLFVTATAQRTWVGIPGPSDGISTQADIFRPYLSCTSCANARSKAKKKTETSPCSWPAPGGQCSNCKRSCKVFVNIGDQVAVLVSVLAKDLAKRGIPKALKAPAPSRGGKRARAKAQPDVVTAPEADSSDEYRSNNEDDGEDMLGPYVKRLGEKAAAMRDDIELFTAAAQGAGRAMQGVARKIGVAATQIVYPSHVASQWHRPEVGQWQEELIESDEDE